jgi:hypothetical protein
VINGWRQAAIEKNKKPDSDHDFRNIDPR